MRNGRWVASRGMDGGGREKARLIRPGFYCDCDEAAALSDAAFDQAISATFGNTAFQQAVRTIFGNAVTLQAVRATLCDATFDQAIRTAFSDDRMGKSICSEYRESEAKQDLAFHESVLRVF